LWLISSSGTRIICHYQVKTWA